jgi:hypothetical protein
MMPDDMLETGPYVTKVHKTTGQVLTYLSYRGIIDGIDLTRDII